MSEKIMSKNNFEQTNNPELLRYETERWLVPLDPTVFAPYEQLAVPIEQTYLSRPDEDYTLRVRVSHKPTGDEYTAALKNKKGVITHKGLERMEIETEISQATYLYYASNPAYPNVEQRRATLLPGVSADWIEDADEPLIEIEQVPGSTLADEFFEDFKEMLCDVTGDPAYDKSEIAYCQFEGTFEPVEQLDAATITDEIVALFQTGKTHAVVGISGMSGSGKTTLAHQVRDELMRRFGAQLPPVIELSTDDYHRGKQYLEATYGEPWTNWDLPEVYDTKTLATHIAALKSGQAIPQQTFDFPSQETVTTGIIEPSPIIIVEGIFAGSNDLHDVRDLHYNVPTPIATTVARDLSRLISTDRSQSSIATPEARLRYQLETAIPTYLAQDRPRRNSWPASVRSIGKVAWLSGQSATDR